VLGETACEVAGHLGDEEAGGQDAARLGGEEPPPGRSTAGSWSNSTAAKDPADRACRDADPESAKLVPNADTNPAAVLPAEATGREWKRWRAQRGPGRPRSTMSLTRSSASSSRADAGVKVQQGTLDDLDILRSAASESDGVIHLAFKHVVAFSGTWTALSMRIAAPSIPSARRSQARIGPWSSPPGPWARTGAAGDRAGGA